jgi:hypothetical protein
VGIFRGHLGGADLDGKFGAMVLDKQVPYLPSLAKMAIAFLNGVLLFKILDSLFHPTGFLISWVKTPLSGEG